MSTIERPGEQRRLEEFHRDRRRCQAYADSTGEQCRRSALHPLPYCSDHAHLLDDVDLKRIGLSGPKSSA